jgi:hypothetical protein
VQIYDISHEIQRETEIEKVSRVHFELDAV